MSLGNLQGLHLFPSIEEAARAAVPDDGPVWHGHWMGLNPEIVVRMGDEPEYDRIVRESVVQYVDGIGVVRLLSRRLGRPVARIPGCELWEAVMARAAQRQLRVFLMGARPEVVFQCATRLRDDLGLEVAGYQHGYIPRQQWHEVCLRIAALQPDVVAVALGAPAQDYFIQRCLQQWDRALYLGIGGTFDVYTGNVWRAPKWLCDLGLEWFFRLLNQPSRIVRQKALPRFVWRSWTGKL